MEGKRNCYGMATPTKVFRWVVRYDLETEQVIKLITVSRKGKYGGNISCRQFLLLFSALTDIFPSVRPSGWLAVCLSVRHKREVGSNGDSYSCGSYVV